MRLRIGAMVLGFIGAISGYTLGILGLAAGGILKELGDLLGVETQRLAMGSMALLPLSLMGVVGAAITLARPRAAGILMLLSAISMVFIGIVLAGAGPGSLSMERLIVAGGPLLATSILLVTASVLAMAGWNEES